MIINVTDYLRSVGVSVDELFHYGTPRHSGRYPWGSGADETPRNRDFLSNVAALKREGLSEPDIAKGMGMTTRQLRAAKSIAKNADKQAKIAQVEKLKATGMSNNAIARETGIPEPTVRTLLVPGLKDKADQLQVMAGLLQENVDGKGYIDVGSGVENQLGVTRNRLDTAIAVLQEQGYAVHTVQVDQLGTAPGNKTAIKVLAPPGTEYRDIATNTENIKSIQAFSDDGGRSFLGIKPPMNIDPQRVQVIYDEDGGSKADGVIYVRPGVNDVSMGPTPYGQVRIAVGGTHYLKGMAVYKDGLPPGVDLQFNTNKKRADTGNNPLEAMKPLKKDLDGNVDMDNPFGSIIRQHLDPKTGNVLSAMNMVGMKEGSGEEGSWDAWSKNLSSQFLSKQSPSLARSQLDVTFDQRRKDLDEIVGLTNPAVKKKLLESFADGTDAASIHLKAAALPDQSTHVILPINSLKPTEIYATNFENGTRVALVRYPHGGTFEIPELVVNNNHLPAKKLIGRARDAVGIHHTVAERLSGADFDGDTVMVIPNNGGKVKSKPALERLKGFDPKTEYRGYPGMKVMDARTKGFQMGDVSNLITDMTIKKASTDEIARAVRHSMVVIDAEKHGLDWKRSSVDNGIAGLKEKYQGGKTAGAATLVSRATSRQDVNRRAPRSAKIGGPIDPATGKKVFTDEPGWVDSSGKTRTRKERSTKLAEVDDAHKLSSGTLMETIYADHSNRMKALANEARKESLHVKPTPYSKSARAAYSSEVTSLKAKLDLAYRNRPLERQAQVIANANVRTRQQANPHMDADELKKVKAQALTEARRRTSAQKQRIEFTDDEWSAIQAGAISNHMLTELLRNADTDHVKARATPKVEIAMSTSKTSLAKQMLAAGHTQADVAARLGVSLSTLKRSL